MSASCSTSLETILLSFNYITNKKNLLTLARQGIHIYPNIFNNLLNKYNLSFLNNRYNYNDYCENFFRDIGFENIDSIDNSSYESCSIIHNMNNPIPPNMKKYDYIYDGGTTEHIFNTPQVFENIINL